MKEITVWIDRGNGWEILTKGPSPVRVELAEEDQEGSQIDSIIFDPNAPDTDEVLEELPRLALVG